MRRRNNGGTRGGATRGLFARGGAASAALADGGLASSSLGEVGAPSAPTADGSEQFGRRRRSATAAVFESVMPRLLDVDWTITLGGFLLYLFVITSYRLPVGDIAVAVALLGVGIQFVQRSGTHGRKLRFPPYLAWFVAFGVWALFASGQSEYPDWVAEQLTNFWKIVLIVFVAANALQNKAQLRLFMVFFLGCFALFPLRGAMFNFFLYGSDVQGRAVWNQLYSNPNDLGAMALLQLSMAAALMVSERKGWIRWATGAGMLLLPFLILLTQSRGVFLGLTVFIAISLTGQRRRLRLLVRLVVVGAVLMTVVPAGVWQRIGTLQHATSKETLDEVDGGEGSARQRYEIWQVAFQIIRDHPITGVGLGAYKPNHERYALRAQFNPTAQGPRDTHSLYFNVLAETGYPGLMLYLGMLGSIIVAAERTRRRCKLVLPDAARQLLILEAGLCGFLVASTFGSLPYLPHLLVHLVLLYALAREYQAELATKGSAIRPRRPVRAAYVSAAAASQPTSV